MKNQLVFVLVLAVCTTIMGTFIFRDVLKPRNVDVAAPVEASMPILVFDVARPHKFWDVYLSEKYLPIGSDGLRVAAIDGASRVSIIRNYSSDVAGQIKQAYIMRTILITGTSTSINEFTGRDIALIGMPLNANDAYKSAISICEIAGIPNSRIKSWWNELQSGKNAPKSCLQIGTAENDIRHEVSIRPSLSHDEKTPWSITYRIYFSGAANSR